MPLTLTFSHANLGHSVTSFDCLLRRLSAPGLIKAKHLIFVEHNPEQVGNIKGSATNAMHYVA